MKRILVVAALIGGAAVMPPSAQTPAAGPAPRHATAVTRLLIANAMVIYGNAQPAFGPVDVLVEDGLIARRRHGPAHGPRRRAGGRRHRRHRQVRDAWDRQHPHALA